MKTILITGGAGYIGSHVNKLLNQSGYQTVVLDSLENGYRDAVKWGKFYQGDIADLDLLNKIFNENDILAVIHFASYISVSDSTLNPDAYYQNNVVKSKVLVDFVVTKGDIPIVFSSSAAVYGEPQVLPLVEDHPFNPISPYGENKLEVEKYLSALHLEKDFAYISLRYFNAAGADPEGEIGERHLPETHLIPLMLAAANGDRDQISIFGSDFDTKDGTCIRDYIHVMDLAQAHINAVEYLFDGGTSGAFNLANGAGYSNLEIVEMVKKVTGRKFLVELADRRAGDPPILIGDSNKAETVLGWKPRYLLEDIVTHAWKWYLKSI